MTKNMSKNSDGKNKNPSVSDAEMMNRIERNYGQIQAKEDALPKVFKEGEGVLFDPAWADDIVIKTKGEDMTQPEILEKADEEEGLTLIKVDAEKRLVYGCFLWPDKADHDGDVISSEDIEKVAHGFMSDYRDIDEMHDKATMDATIVESAIAWDHGIDFHGKILDKGAWFGAIKVHDDAVWEKIKAGKYKGFSVRISGVREPIEG